MTLVLATEVDGAVFHSTSTEAARSWKVFAACRDADPEVFFPTVQRGVQADVYAEALRFCARCPVVSDCLASAMDNGDLYDGVFGGKTPSQRRKLRERNGRALTFLICRICGCGFKAHRSDTLYCSPPCRSVASTRAKRARGAA